MPQITILNSHWRSEDDQPTYRRCGRMMRKPPFSPSPPILPWMWINYEYVERCCGTSETGPSSWRGEFAMVWAFTGHGGMVRNGPMDFWYMILYNGSRSRRIESDADCWMAHGCVARSPPCGRHADCWNIIGTGSYAVHLPDESSQ